MSKRPRIKQADGSLLDLPLDAETIKGKTLEEIALKTDIPTKTSQLTNDTGLLTELPDNVVTKNEEGNIVLENKDEGSRIELNNYGNIDATYGHRTVRITPEEGGIQIYSDNYSDRVDYVVEGISYTDINANTYFLSFPKETGTILTDSSAIYTNRDITTSKNLVVYSDDEAEEESGLQPTNTNDIDTTYCAKGLVLYNNDNGDIHRIQYPMKSGTIALLEDIQSGGGGGNGSLKLFTTGTIINGETYRLNKPLENNKLYVYEVLTETGYYITNTLMPSSEGYAEVLSFVYDAYNDELCIGRVYYSGYQTSLTFTNLDYTLDDSTTSTTLNIYEVVGGSSGGGTLPNSDALKLIETGTTTYEQETLTLQKPLENNKVYVMTLPLADDLLSFIVMVDYKGYITSTNPYYSAWGDYARVECNDRQNINVVVSGEYDVFGDGTYEIYELAGGTSSASAKLKKENYISSIRARKKVLEDFNGEGLNTALFIEFTQPVDIVVETPRTRTFKTNTASEPSLYRPIGGQRVFTDKEYLTYRDIFKLMFSDFDFNTISEIYNPSQSAEGKGCRYLVFRDSQYSLENRMGNENIEVIGYYNSKIMSNFFTRERWTSKQMTFILKPVINYEEKEYEENTHYTYLTGTHAIEIQIILSYDNRDGKNTNDNLQYLINYKIVELD